MNKIRVVVVDDSALVRSLMSAIIDREPDMKVVGTAADPYAAREIIRNLDPDVITLDVEMPRMDGLDFLEKIMRLRPMPVVMVSTLTERGAEVTLRALELGAVDYVAKPRLGIANGLQEAAQEIVDKIRVASRARVGRARLPGGRGAAGGLGASGGAGAPGGLGGAGGPGGAGGSGGAVAGYGRVAGAGMRAPDAGGRAGQAVRAPLSLNGPHHLPGSPVGAGGSEKTGEGGSVSAGSGASASASASAGGLRTMRGGTEKLIAIGASTGGTEAIREVLMQLPPDAPAVVITQHMPPGFTRSFAERLDGLCRIRVKEAAHGERLLPGHAYIAPGGRHLRVERNGANYQAHLDDSEPVNRHRPSVDVLFGSVARCAGPNAVGVMLTGMGRDGAEQMRAMREAGAHNLAQDEASCVVYGMPKEAVAVGAVHEVLPLERIGARLNEWIHAAGAVRHRI